MSFSLKGRTYVVMGVANKRSIAWGIARSLHDAGARLVFTYAGERLESSVRELADSLEGTESFVLPCDVTMGDTKNAFGAFLPLGKTSFFLLPANAEKSISNPLKNIKNINPKVDKVSIHISG